MNRTINQGYEIYPSQTVYLEPLNEKLKIYSGLQNGEVIAVGKKYLTIKIGGWKYLFDLKTLKQIKKIETSKGKKIKIVQLKDNIKDWNLFLTKNEYEKEQYYRMLFAYIKQKIGNKEELCTLSLETLENIRCIIDKGEDLYDNGRS